MWQYISWQLNLYTEQLGGKRNSTNELRKHTTNSSIKSIKLPRINLSNGIYSNTDRKRTESYKNKEHDSW